MIRAHCGESDTRNAMVEAADNLVFEQLRLMRVAISLRSRMTGVKSRTASPRSKRARERLGLSAEAASNQFPKPPG